jgi:hypothetical protein
MKCGLLAAFLVLCNSGPLLAQAEEVAPYVDPSQLDVPWPKHSFYKEPWRAYLETRPAETLVHGIGINYNLPASADDLTVRLLAESGFKSFRIEVGWDQVTWDETHLRSEARFKHLLVLCKQYGIRPNLLLNANHGAPCPVRFFEKRLAEDAPAGSRVVKFTDITDLVVGHSGINHLSSSAAAEALIIAFNTKTGECRLSKPLPKGLVRGARVPMATLKYVPLFPVGTPEFEETAKGWLRYATLVTDLARTAGIDDFDVEIWNELSFGSNFTDARHYYDPPPFPKAKHFLHPGGSCWELARRTVASVKAAHPHARCIWGFSNTTFFDCPITDLPPGMDGQSYHPYGTGTHTYPKDEDYKDRPWFNIDGFTPTLQTRLPEGWAQLYLKTESLIRLLDPRVRTNHPSGTSLFHHYMTEHGVVPAECGISDTSGSWDIKTRCALRSYCFWINKGIDVLDYYCAYESKPTGMGLLPPDITKLPADAKWEDVATPPMRAVRNLARAFDGAKPIKLPVPLRVAVTELGEPRKIFNGDGKHPPLWQRQAFAVLPFQVDDHRFVIAAYAMTYDATKRFEPQRYRLTLGGFPGRPESVSLYDPMTDAKPPLNVQSTNRDSVTVEFAATDMPQLVTIVTR